MSETHDAGSAPAPARAPKKRAAPARQTRAQTERTATQRRAIGGEQLRALMEAVADDVDELLRSCFKAESLHKMLAQFAGVDAPAIHPPLDMPSKLLTSPRASIARGRASAGMALKPSARLPDAV